MSDHFKTKVLNPEKKSLPAMEQLQIKDPVEKSPVPERPGTLFPKITGKIAEIVQSYNYKLKEDNGFEAGDAHWTAIKFIGTVKLHGAHADIVIHSDDTVQLQSRNVVGLSLEKDAYGIAKAMLPLKAESLDLKRRYRQRFLELNPGAEINEEYPMIIAGEWIGPGVQKTVAIAELPEKCFVILSVSINNAWLPDEPYADIHNEAVGIYNVSRGGFYHEELVSYDIEGTREKLHALTMAVEKECPFAKTFGISGIGEGIVWKAEHPLGDDARFWFKTKGPLHRVTTTEKLKQKPDASEQQKVDGFAEAAVTENRLEQGWAYLEELGIKRDMKAIREFMVWVAKDVEIEERLEIKKMGINPGLLRKRIVFLSRTWYMKKLE